MSGQTPGEGPGDTPTSSAAPDEDHGASSVSSEPSPGAPSSSTPIWDALVEEYPEIGEALA